MDGDVKMPFDEMMRKYPAPHFASQWYGAWPEDSRELPGEAYEAIAAAVLSFESPGERPDNNHIQRARKYVDAAIKLGLVRKPQ